VPYVSSLQAPELILKDNPRAKFLFSLRDPVLRAWSDYRFQKRKSYRYVALHISVFIVHHSSAVVTQSVGNPPFNNISHFQPSPGC